MTYPSIALASTSRARAPILLLNSPAQREGGREGGRVTVYMNMYYTVSVNVELALAHAKLMVYVHAQSKKLDRCEESDK